MQGRLVLNGDDQKERARKMGITDFDRKYEVDEMAKGRCRSVCHGRYIGVNAFGYIASKWRYLDRNPAHALIDRHHSLD